MPHTILRVGGYHKKPFSRNRGVALRLAARNVADVIPDTRGGDSGTRRLRRPDLPLAGIPASRSFVPRNHFIDTSKGCKDVVSS